MSTRAIRTTPTQESCDVCGRTLLRGERAEIYVSGGSRRSVCELCTSRALHGGWVREGEVPSYDDLGTRPERRRSLIERLFGARQQVARRRPIDDARWDYEDLSEPVDDDPEVDAAPPSRRRPQPDASAMPGADGEEGFERPRRRRSSASSDGERPATRRRMRPRAPAPGAGREPRHVHAVPTSIEHRISSAVDLFNDSEHTRTIAGVARSLGLPEASVHPSDIGGSVVWLVVAWELCWYRYEADLSDEVPAVRLAGQGYELSELTATERQANAVADERGRLHLA